MLAYAALVFRRIGQEETPFFPALPRKVKLAAPFLFLAVAVPRWIGYAVLGAATGRVVGTLFDETSIILLAPVAIVAFCLGQDTRVWVAVAGQATRSSEEAAWRS